MDVMDIDVFKRFSLFKIGFIDQIQWSCFFQIGLVIKRMINIWIVFGFFFVCSVIYVIWTGFVIIVVVGMFQFFIFQLLGGFVNLFFLKKTGECSDCGFDYFMRVYGILFIYYCVIVKVDNKYMYYSINFFYRVCI